MEENEDIKKAKEELDRISQDDLLRRRLLKAELLRMDQEQITYEAVRDGKKEKTIEIAKKMLKKKMAIETIMELTELSKEEIDEIIKSS